MATLGRSTSDLMGLSTVAVLCITVSSALRRCIVHDSVRHKIRCSLHYQQSLFYHPETTSMGFCLYSCLASMFVVHDYIMCSVSRPYIAPPVLTLRMVYNSCTPRTDNGIPLDDLDLSGQIYSRSVWSRSCCRDAAVYL